jgi:formylglycine-generating enzyme required for sulfatase activity
MKAIKILLLLLITGCATLQPTLEPQNNITSTSTPSFQVETVKISDGTAMIGRSPEEIDADYSICVSAIGESACSPKENIFGDVPLKNVKLKGFYIAKYEYHDSQGMPIVMTYTQAQDVCAKQEGRLPTVYEWEFAARGEKGRIWPWGNEVPTEYRANLDLIGGNPDRPIEKVGSYPNGATPEGVQDMVGNVWEWTLEGYRKGGGAGTYTVFAKPSHNSIGELAGVRCVFDY